MRIDPQHLEQKPNFSKAKKALLEKRLHGGHAPHSDLTIRKRAAGDFAPLSPAQLRLWYLHQIDPEGSGYNYSTALLLTGKLDIPVLQKCIDEIVRRHEILRTTFEEKNGQPVQIIAPELCIPLEIRDLSLLTKSQREAGYIRLAKDEGKMPFNLLTGPVLRVTLIRLDESEFVLLFTVHHIVYDGWSAGILLSEFVTLYRTFVYGQTSLLPELPIQYADFAEWQHNYLQEQRLGQQLSYWKKELEGIPMLLELPSDRSRPAVRSYTGSTYSFSLSSKLTERLRNVSRSCDCTLFTTLLSCFNILLHRYSGEKDICVGIPFAGRMKPELENLIGFFINTLVIRTKFDNNPHLIELIKRTHTVILDAQSNQDVPFDRLVEELKPQRNQGYNPLFQVMFVLHNMPLSSVDLPDLKLETIEVDYEVSKFDLVLHATEKECLELSFEYSTELFNSDRIERLARYFKLILGLFTDNLNAHVGNFELLTQKEHCEIAKWNSTERVFPQKQLLHAWFENQAQDHPQSIAIRSGLQTLTYNELDRRANQLAHWLRSHGVEPEVRVGVCLERSLEMIVGILAILKAGGAYVPINTTTPKERISSILTDCDAQILLTQEQLLAGRLSTELMVFCLDRDWEQLSNLPTNNAAFQQHSSSAAYVIYTSGSTGSPKGVIVTHENAVASTWARFDYYQEPLDGFLLMSPLAFDSSVAGIFWTLSLGGRLCVPTEEEIQDIEALVGLVEQEKLSHLLCLPSFYGLILDYVSNKRLNKLRAVIVAGEACLPELVAKHNLRLPTVRLYNEYGPTEATVWTSVYELRSINSDSGQSHLPIGQPISNSQIYLLDSYLNQVSVGVPGELYICGAGLTRGYLGRPDLTAERFAPNPFNSEHGGRLYRTGDLARYRADGNIEFLGRIDHQVKIRGFRIELGEIESRLRQYPGIQDALVIAHEDFVGNKRLVAYWVNGANSFPELESIRTFLKQTLPDYMIPAAFVKLDKLPLTPNGKLDHKGLPDPCFNDQLVQQTVPCNTIEEKLVKIWCQILGLERIGIHDNFFDLGGDSIMAIQIVGRARQVDLIFTAHQLFQQQTIAKLAKVAGRVANAQCSEQGAISGVVPLTPIQSWFFEKNLPNPSHWNQAVLLEVKGFVEPFIFEQAVMYLISHHDALRSRFSLEGDMWRQNTLMQESHVVFHCVDLSEVDQSEQAESIEAECSRWQASLHLTDGPLLRMVWFDLCAGCNPRLLLAIHHLVVDGVSWRILLEDLQTICRQLMQGITVALLPKTTSFRYWAERLHQWVQSEDLQKEAAYWRRTTQAVVAPLPVDYPDGTREDRQTATVIADLGEAETRALLLEASAAYRTDINDLLLAALAQTLSDWINVPEVLIDIESHGREDLFGDVDLSRTVGWFTSVYPVHFKLPVENTPGAVIKAVKEEIRHIPHKGIGYTVLRYLNRDVTSVPFKTHSCSQVLFNYLGRLDRVLPEDSLFDRAWESAGREQDADGLHSYELEINAHISREKLHIVWTYSGDRYRRKTIEILATSYIKALKELIEHCLSPDAGGYTPSDFPLAGIGQVKLDSLISRFAKKT